MAQQQLERFLLQERVHSPSPSGLQEVQHLPFQPSTQQQLDALGKLDHSAKGNGLKDQKSHIFPHCHISCYDLDSEPKKRLPTAFRPRLLHFIFIKMDDQSAKKLLLGRMSGSEFQIDHQISIQPEPYEEQPHPTIPAHARDGSGGSSAAPTDLVTNLSSVKLQPHERFYFDMQERGTVKWIIHDDEREVFAINDVHFHKDRYMFQASNFVFVTLNVNGTITCSCDLYEIACESEEFNNSCLHCYHMQKLIADIRSVTSGLVPKTVEQKNLLSLFRHANDGCQPVSVCGRTRRYCVRGNDDTIALVSIDSDDLVVCKSKSCEAAKGKSHKKKAIELMRGSKVPAKKNKKGEVSKKNKKEEASQKKSTLCPHLDMFQAYEEIWRGAEAVDTAEASEVPSAFDPATGLWDFGGYLQHCPTSWGVYDRSQLLKDLQLDSEGYLSTLLLKPALPSTACLCGVSAICIIFFFLVSKLNFFLAP